MFKKSLSFVCALIVALSVYASAPKYVFFFIGDGMGLGHVMSAETYNRTVLKNNNHLLMMRFPVTSVATTYSASNPITDSAAAGTALSTGTKTKNGMLGQDGDTVNVYSIAQEFKQKGYGVAIATNVPIDDATPAAYYAHQPSRKMFYEIGKDMAASGFDFFAGAALRGTTDKNGKPNDLLPTIKKAGYTIISSFEDYAKKKNAKKILLQNPANGHAHVGFTIDSMKGNFSLPFITKACIDHMNMVSPSKFFMMIEGGNIDWAAHSNDTGATIKEILNFNEAIQEAYDFYLQHPDETLIVITADHNTGGMAVGTYNGPSTEQLKNIDYQKVSIENFSLYCDGLKKSGKPITWDDMKDYLRANLGLYGAITVKDYEDAMLHEDFDKSFKGKNGKNVEALYATFNGFIQSVYKLLDKKAGIGWTTGYHTGDLVPVYAIGVGAEKFSNFNDNTDLPKKIRKICDLH